MTHFTDAWNSAQRRTLHCRNPYRIPRSPLPPSPNSTSAHLSSLYRDTAERSAPTSRRFPSRGPSPPTLHAHKIICVGRNYGDHVNEMGNDLPTEPLLFFKPVSSLLSPGGIVRMPAVSSRVDYEGELALVIGRRARYLEESDWRSAIRGYTLANDVTARDLQNKDGQWTRAKGFDTFCPVGPIVSDELDPDSGLILETRVNGTLRQHGSTLDFIFPIPKLLAYITAVMTLEPGDLILTGTPSGVGPLSPAIESKSPSPASAPSPTLLAMTRRYKSGLTPTQG